MVRGLVWAALERRRLCVLGGFWGVRLRSGRFADDGVRGVCVRGRDGCREQHRACGGGVLVPALEKMPQLTSLNIACARIGLSETGALGGFSFWVLFGCAVRWGLNVRLDGV